FFQAEDGMRYWSVTGVQTCALPISVARAQRSRAESAHAADPARVVVLEERQGLSSEAVRGVGLSREYERQVPRHRVEVLVGVGRSEERRVGKARRSRKWQDDESNSR